MQPTPPSPDRAAERPTLRDALALAALRGVGPVGYRARVAQHGDAARALGVTPAADRRDALAQADDILARCTDAEIAVVTDDDPRFPAALRDLPDAPPLLFALGDLRLLERPCVAIVGTRSATPYGLRVVRDLSTALGRAGAAVVSGMALGIDAAAHVAALDADAATIAVLGTGVDVPYPAAHGALHARIAQRGLLLGERPPGSRAAPGVFPRRNRIIAAVASLTVVVEAGSRSGALITAGHALDLGRMVAAVPGPITSATSAGSNELLRDGAHAITSVADLLALAGVSAPIAELGAHLTGAERMVWSALAAGASDVDTLCSRTSLPTRDCLGAVSALELAGAVECLLTGEIRRR